MKYCLITFRSLTMTQKAEGLLRRKGFICTLQRTPRWMEEQGCGTALEVQYTDIDGVQDVLQKNRIMYKRVYVRTRNDTMEELSR